MDQLRKGITVYWGEVGTGGTGDVSLAHSCPRGESPQVPGLSDDIIPVGASHQGGRLALTRAVFGRAGTWRLPGLKSGNSGSSSTC